MWLVSKTDGTAVKRHETKRERLDPAKPKANQTQFRSLHLTREK